MTDYQTDVQPYPNRGNLPHAPQTPPWAFVHPGDYRRHLQRKRRSLAYINMRIIEKSYEPKNILDLFATLVGPESVNNCGKLNLKSMQNNTLRNVLARYNKTKILKK